MVLRDFPSFALVLEFPTGRNFYTLHQKHTNGNEKRKHEQRFAKATVKERQKATTQQVIFFLDICNM